MQFFANLDGKVADRLAKSNRTQRSIPVYAYEDGALEVFAGGGTAASSEFMISRIAYWQTSRRLLA